MGAIFFIFPLIVEQIVTIVVLNRTQNRKILHFLLKIVA